MYKDVHSSGCINGDRLTVKFISFSDLEKKSPEQINIFNTVCQFIILTNQNTFFLGKMPTVVFPDLYKSRFLEAMDRYFPPVPDRWSGLGYGLDY